VQRPSPLPPLLLALCLSTGPFACGDDDGDDDDDTIGDGDADSDADADADGDGDGDADTVCEDLVNDCGYDPGCNGMVGPDGCICTRERPQQTECLPDQVQTTCDTCYSFGAVPWFCAGYPRDGWRWRRADDVESWSLCTEEQRCESRSCHGAAGDEAYVCNGTEWVPAAEVTDC
jgi:hypothetical protein